MQNENFYDNDELKFENEIIKLKLRAEHGGMVYGNEGVPPEIENMFLKNILHMQAYRKQPEIQTVYEFLGKPEYKPVAEFTDEKMAEEEHEKVLDLLNEKGVFIDYCYDEPPVEERYRFLVTDIFNAEIEVFDIPGMAMHFIYEEYYPNQKLNIHFAVEDTLRQVFSHRREFDDYGFVYLADEIIHNGELCMKSEFLERLAPFWDSYEQLRMSGIEIHEPEIHEKGAHVCFDAKYTGVPEGSGKEITHGISGQIEFILEKEDYNIRKIQLPGILT